MLQIFYYNWGVNPLLYRTILLIKLQRALSIIRRLKTSHSFNHHKFNLKHVFNKEVISSHSDMVSPWHTKTGMATYIHYDNQYESRREKNYDRDTLRACRAGEQNRCAELETIISRS